MAFSYPIFSIVPCCSDLGEQLDNFRELIGFQPMFDELPGTFIYEGPNQTLNGIQFKTGYCYTVTQVGFGLVSGFGFNFNLFNQIPVENCESLECESCELPSCYELTKCGETTASIISNSSTLFQFYENDKIVKLAGYEGCYTINVVENCDCAVSVTVTQSYDSCEDCLPVIAYKFTNCDNPSLIQYSTNDYSEYVGKTVELECGGCWIVSEINITPPSTQDPVIQYVFDNCAACNRTYYKLSDCLNPNNVTYTYTDLSSLTPTPIAGCDCIRVTYQLVGEEPVTVEVESSGIYNGKPYYQFEIESINLFTIIWDRYTSSEWELDGGTEDRPHLNSDTPCPFGTYTIEEGSLFESFIVEPCSVIPVIKIKGCDTCFTVEETREPINAGIVEVTDSYIDCPECLNTFPCVCSRITNQNTVTKVFTYINCLFDEVNITLAPNETSDKVCLSSWVLTPEEEALVYIEHFGDCVNNQCPVEPLPKRKVKPGYSAPICDPDKYEKITCKASEIYYKQVMRLRYGISNCCPEDEEKWLIKKELIDLQALVDPDYICQPVTTCCNQPIDTCGCGCNQPIKTCNSQ